jgi:hypothetical protein
MLSDRCNFFPMTELQLLSIQAELLSFKSRQGDGMTRTSEFTDPPQ